MCILVSDSPMHSSLRPSTRDKHNIFKSAICLLLSDKFLDFLQLRVPTFQVTNIKLLLTINIKYLQSQFDPFLVVPSGQLQLKLPTVLTQIMLGGQRSVSVRHSSISTMGTAINYQYPVPHVLYHYSSFHYHLIHTHYHMSS